jgi:uncharacterized protein (TIGR02246 family)
VSELEELAARLARIEDERAIEALKHAYTGALDSGYDLDAIASLFTAEARWTADGFGDLAGREAIRDFFAGLSRQVVRVRHFATSPQVELGPGDGVATARWDLLCMCTRRYRDDPDRELPIVEVGGYRDRLVKRDGRWLFDEIVVDVTYAGALGDRVEEVER